MVQKIGPKPEFTVFACVIELLSSVKQSLRHFTALFPLTENNFIVKNKPEQPN